MPCERCRGELLQEAAGEGSKPAHLPGRAGHFPSTAVPVPHVRICVIGSSPLPLVLNKYFSKISLNSLIALLELKESTEQDCCMAGTAARPAPSPQILHLPPKKSKCPPPLLCLVRDKEGMSPAAGELMSIPGSVTYLPSFRLEPVSASLPCTSLLSEITA